MLPFPDGDFPDDDALLSRSRTAELLTAAGYRTAPATLATKAARGDGPPYELFGRWPVYRWGTSLAWARNRLVAPRSRSGAA